MDFVNEIDVEGPIAQLRRKDLNTLDGIDHERIGVANAPCEVCRAVRVACIRTLVRAG